MIDVRHSRPIAATLLIAAALVATACAPGASSVPSVGSATTQGASQSAAAAATPAASEAVPSATPKPSPLADVAVQTVVAGLTAPVGLVAVPGDATHVVILEQTGLISLLDVTTGATTPFLDLRDRVVPLRPDYDERGLLGFAFHPDFATNGRVFVYYGAPLRAGAAAGQDHTNTLSEFHVDPARPDRADATSERTILQFEQPQFNHSGGGLGFGPDGMLYLGTGDGGGQGDASEGHSPRGNAQDLAKLNGKILRLDVDGKRPYSIPADNPSLGKGARPEIYAYGLRNPWRLSWEPGGDRQLIVSDVGYGRFEEIDTVTSGGNYGWRIREGAHCLDVARTIDRTRELRDDRCRRQAADRSRARVHPPMPWAWPSSVGTCTRARPSRPCAIGMSSPTSRPTRTTTCPGRWGRFSSRHLPPPRGPPGTGAG